MRSLVLVAGETARWAGAWLVAERGARERGSSAATSPGAEAAVTVHLVGAGPGDPALLTIAAADAAARRARRRLRPAVDGRDRRARARRTPSVHCVGRAPGRRALAAGRGQRAAGRARRARGDVVRLKSGDPFVASRGGEEAVALQRRRASTCSVIPGVSSALAAPAAAGIPLMLRQLSVTATFVDGNDDDEHAEPPDWATLARLGGTLVILTGRGRIRRIAAALMDGGRAPDTPIAAISAASRGRAARAARHARRAARPAAAARDLRRRRGRRARLTAPLEPHAHPRRLPDRRGRGDRRRHRRGGRRRVPARRARGRTRERDLPLAGLAAAFFLVGEAPMVPITVGTQGAPARRGARRRAARAVAGRADDRRRVR